MSDDDDLWRPTGASADPGASGDRQDAGGPPAPDSPRVSDETQPLHGAATPPSDPPSSPPSTPPSGEAQPQPPVPPAAPSAVPPPQNPYGQSSPYGAPPPQNPYGQPPYGAPSQPFSPPPNPYAAPHEYASPQSPYGATYQPTYAGGALPDHPSATTAMVLGIVSLVGILFCGGLTLVIAPAAWVVGRKAVREIDASGGRYGGRDRAQAGKIMGIIGTVLLVIGVLVFVAAVALLVTTGSNPQPVGQQRGFLNG